MTTILAHATDRFWRESDTAVEWLLSCS